MSTIGRAKMRGDVPYAFRKMNKKVWTQEFKDAYRTSVREYEKPSDKKRKARKQAVRKQQQANAKQQSDYHKKYRENMK